MAAVRVAAFSLPARISCRGGDVFASRVWTALKARPASEIVGYGVILARNALGLPNPMRTRDRDTLEKVILAHYVKRADIERVLFVGCAWYTRHYETAFAD